MGGCPPLNDAILATVSYDYQCLTLFPQFFTDICVFLVRTLQFNCSDVKTVRCVLTMTRKNMRIVFAMGVHRKTH